MSSGDGHKHHPDRHAGFPSKYQRKSSQLISHSNIPNHQQQNQSQAHSQVHTNSYGINFGHPQYQSHNVAGTGHGHRHSHHVSTSNYPSDNQVGSSHIQTRSQQDSYGESRQQLPAYPEPPKYPGQRVEENHKDRKPPPEDDGEMHSWRSMRLEELKEMCQSQINDLRISREQIQRLTDDNQELRDLCCFLDDDRQKGRKLAREWQRFGRYTASVMRQEVSAYQNKLRELDTKQQELIKDNLELKELCLYLDEERSNATCAHCGHPISLRDDGDGSSSSTNADEPTGPSHIQQTTHTAAPPPINSHIPLSRSSSRELLMHDSVGSQRSAFNEQILSYIRSLEARILLLETEKQTLSEEIMKGGRTLPEGEGNRENDNSEGSSNGEYHRSHRPPQPPPYSLAHQMRALGLGIGGSGPLVQDGDDDLLGLPPPPPVSRPAAVAAAMRVLEVQEQLESPPPPPPPNMNSVHNSHPTMNQQTSHVHSHSTSSASTYFNQHSHGSQDSALADGEKAILRQMCNVVWKKLEEVPSEHR